jgi:maleate cis-trans isomerase
MDTTEKLRIGFVSASGASSPHFAGFRALIPSDVEFDFEGLGLDRGSLYVAEERARAAIRSAQAVEARGCQGVVVSGAPAEVLNPDLQQRLETAVKVPVATAMTACAAALKSLDARCVLVLTPFDPETNGKISDILEARSIEAVMPRTTFGAVDEAMHLTSEAVYALAQASLEAAGGVDAVYFQGAVLDPLQIMDRLERDSGIPVVASNPAMLWYILSKLGRTYRIDGHGRLLREWPKPVA